VLCIAEVALCRPWRVGGGGRSSYQDCSFRCVWLKLLHLLGIHAVFGTNINWWLRWKDRKAWTIDIHKIKVVEMHT
jgi:hypothetical protein